jgi:hypothetical protein
MADLYSILAGIQPDQQDVVEAELLAKQILEAQFPDLDLRQGTAVRDLVLRPAAFLLALCKKSVDFHFAQNTIAGITDDTPEEMVDDILGNLFLTRNTGQFAVINARLFFARQKPITLTTGNSFSPNNTQLFFPLTTTTYPSQALQLDAFSDEWYLDVDLIAANKGSDYNIGEGSLLYFNSPDPFFLRGEINFLVQESTDPETNSQFIARAESAISTRNLINIPSIDNRLRQDFNYVNRVKVIGAGAPEIYRDQVQARGMTHAAVTGTAWSFTDSNTTLTITLTNHGLSFGQLVNIVESGSGPGLLVIHRSPVTLVLDANTFKISVPYSVTPRALAAPLVSKVDDDVYVHQGGAADIHVGEDIESSVVQYTLDSDGRVYIPGPYYQITRFFATGGDSPDTVPEAAPYVLTWDNFTSRSGTGVSLAQSLSGDLVLTLPQHPLSVGRMVQVSGWPSPSSVMYETVSQVLDENNVVLGRNLPTFSPSPGLTPSVTFTSPEGDTGHSVRQVVYADFGSTYAGALVSMTLNGFKNLDSIQAYLDIPENHVVCADYLARGFDIYVLDFDITVYDTVAPSSASVKNTIQAFLKAMSVGQEFVLSDLVAAITASGVSHLKTPIIVNYSYFTKDWLVVKSGSITDILSPATSTSIFVVRNVTTNIEEA